MHAARVFAAVLAYTGEVAEAAHDRIIAALLNGPAAACWRRRGGSLASTRRPSASSALTATLKPAKRVRFVFAAALGELDCGALLRVYTWRGKATTSLKQMFAA